MRRTTTVMLVLATSLSSSIDGAFAQDAAPPSKADDPFAHARSDAEKISVRLQADKSKKLELQPGPLFAFEEVIRPWDKGTSWVWGSKGRPAVFLNMSTHGNTRYYEFLSLTTERMKIDTGYGSQWDPEPGWRPLPIDRAPAPAADRRRRMVQMRSLARRFTAHSIDQYEEGARHNLELLPQPVYRYADQSDESLDGGIFAFCRDNNVEAILVIDATKTKDGNERWMFGCNRMSVHELHVELDGQEVWKREGIPFAAATPQSSYHIFSRPAREEEKAGR